MSWFKNITMMVLHILQFLDNHLTSKKYLGVKHIGVQIPTMTFNKNFMIIKKNNYGVYTLDNKIGNLSTIIKFIATTIAGWIIALATANGLNLTVDASTLAEVIGAGIGLAFGYIDAKYPNTFKWLGNAKLVPDTNEPVLNDEYECDDDGSC